MTQIKQSVWAKFSKFVEKMVDLEEEKPTEKEEVTYAEATLEDGTVIMTTADEWAEGVDVFVLNNEGEQIPVPQGEYTLNDGRILMVAEEGIVASISEAPEEEVEQPEEVEQSEETPYATKEDVQNMLNSFLDTLKGELKPEMSEDTKKELEETKAELEKVKAEFSHKGLPKAIVSKSKEKLDLSKIRNSHERALAFFNHNKK